MFAHTTCGHCTYIGIGFVSSDLCALWLSMWRQQAFAGFLSGCQNYCSWQNKPRPACCLQTSLRSLTSCVDTARAQEPDPHRDSLCMRHSWWQSNLSCMLVYRGLFFHPWQYLEPRSVPAPLVHEVGKFQGGSSKHARGCIVWPDSFRHGQTLLLHTDGPGSRAWNMVLVS